MKETSPLEQSGERKLPKSRKKKSTKLSMEKPKSLKTNNKVTVRQKINETMPKVQKIKCRMATILRRANYLGLAQTSRRIRS